MCWSPKDYGVPAFVPQQELLSNGFLPPVLDDSGSLKYGSRELQRSQKLVGYLSRRKPEYEARRHLGKSSELVINQIMVKPEFDEHGPGLLSGVIPVRR